MKECILYSFRRCPYAMRARWALLCCNIKVILREVDLKNKPSSLSDYSKKGTVPVLITNEGEVIDESLEIMLWAIKNYNDDNLEIKLPFEQNSQVFKLIKENDIEFKYHLDRYKYPNRYIENSRYLHENKARNFLLKWNYKIQQSHNKSSSNGWLLGDSESLADWALWPFVRQYSKVNPEKFNSDKNLEALRSWLDYYINHKLFKTLMYKHTPWDINGSAIVYP